MCSFENVKILFYRYMSIMHDFMELDCKEIKPVNPKGNQSSIFVGKTDAEAPILRPLDAKNQLIVKDPDAAKD